MTTSETLTKSGLADILHKTLGERRNLSRATSLKFVEVVFQKMEKNLVLGNDIKISSFGTFSIRKKNARMGRNPKTGVEAPISQRRVITFKSSASMKEIINS